MTCLRRLEQDLQVAVRPLAQRAVGARATARVEHLAQLHDEPLPLFISQPAIELHRAGYADRESEDRTPCRAQAHVDAAGRVRDRVGRNTDFTADRLQIGEGQPFILRNFAVGGRRRFRGRAKDRGDFLVIVPAFGHALR